MRRAFQNVWVGDIFDAEVEGSDFDRVITLSHDAVDATTEHIPLNDDESCSYEHFSEATDAVLRAIDSEDSTLLHCNLGSSRSVTVAAAAITADTGVSIDKTIAKVRCGMLNPHPKLSSHARKYGSQ